MVDVRVVASLFNSADSHRSIPTRIGWKVPGRDRQAPYPRKTNPKRAPSLALYARIPKLTLDIQAADPASTTRVLSSIINLSLGAKDYAALNSNITLLSKKHGQLKEPVKAMVEEAAGWLEAVKAEAGEAKWLELLETLRAVTEGKVHIMPIHA